MADKKRPVEEAYSSFLNSDKNSDVLRKLGEEELRAGWFGRPSKFESAYRYAYENADSEEDANNAIRDFITNVWARGDVATRKMGFDKAFKDVNPQNPPRPSDVEKTPLSGDDISSRMSERYLNPDEAKDAEAQKNSDAVRNNPKFIEQEYEAEKNAGKDNYIPYDESAVSFNDIGDGLKKVQELDSHLVSILGLSGVTDTKNVKRSVNNLKKDSDYETYGDAMKTASTIVEICNRIYKIEPSYRFKTGLVADSKKLANAVVNSDAGFWSKVGNIAGSAGKGLKGGSANDSELNDAYVRLSGRSHKLDKLNAEELIRFIKEIKSNYPKEVSWFKYVNDTLENEVLTKRSYDRAAGDSGYISMWNDAWNNVNKRLGNMSRPGDIVELSDKLLNSGLMHGNEKGLNDLKTIAGAKALQMGVNAGESQGFNTGALNVGGEKK